MESEVRHTGVDAPRINPKDLLGYTVGTAAPTYTGEEGEVNYFSASGVYQEQLYSGGAWRDVANFQSIERTIPYAVLPVVENVVSYLAAGSSTNVLTQDMYGDNQNAGDTNGNNRLALRFTAPIPLTGFTATLSVKKTGSPVDATFELYSDSAGTPNASLESQTVTASGITGSYATVSKTFTSTLAAGTKYWLVFAVPGNSDAANYYTLKVGLFGFYYDGAKFNRVGSVWSSDTIKLFFTLSGTWSAGLYKTLDVPNNIGLQQNCVGVVKSVDTTAVAARVVLGGFLSSANFGVGQPCFSSTTTAGSTATTGNQQIGIGIYGGLLVYPLKRCAIAYSGNLATWTRAIATGLTFTVHPGFQARRASAKMTISGARASIGWSDTGGIKVVNGSGPVAASTLWDVDEGSQGGTGDITAYGTSNLTIVTTSSGGTTISSTGGIYVEGY